MYLTYLATFPELTYRINRIQFPYFFIIYKGIMQKERIGFFQEVCGLGSLGSHSARLVIRRVRIQSEPRHEILSIYPL
jgi:hypothetical protein